MRRQHPEGQAPHRRERLIDRHPSPACAVTLSRAKLVIRRYVLKIMTTAQHTDSCCQPPLIDTFNDAHFAGRPEAMKRALRLEYLTVSWNIVEGAVSVAAAAMAGSVALLGFGIDSFVECASAGVIIWRLLAEQHRNLANPAIDRLEHRARRLVAGSLFLLSAYVLFDATTTLWTQQHPAFSAVGVTVMALSVAVMLFLARAKRQVARVLGSEAMEADAFQTTACWWLSLTALTGVGLNGALGWWWADPVSAIALSLLIAKEGREAWQGRGCC
jgi:divalent metal cation (Fe/Co/Zn/Cd) transporter